jgi:hypothetical protein|tara:strand:- start:64 stop:795 length:732 start_codon:yes stop_codon:yes gene_type:complete
MSTFKDDPEIQALLQFAQPWVWSVAVPGVGPEKQRLVRRCVGKFLLAMLRIAEFPPRKVSVEDLHIEDSFGRACINAFAAVDQLHQISVDYSGLDDDTRKHQALFELCRRFSVAAGSLISDVLREGNRPSVGFCPACTEVWLRSSSRRSPTHPGACYQQRYEETQRSGTSTERYQRVSKTREAAERKEVLQAFDTAEGSGRDTAMVKGLYGKGHLTARETIDLLESGWGKRQVKPSRGGSVFG